MKKITLILVTFLCLTTIHGQTPSWSWAKGAGGDLGDGVSSICTDSLNNVYVTGLYFSSSITFDSITFSTAGLNDIYFVKYNQNGNVIWAKTIGGIGNEVPAAIAIDAIGNIYLAGAFTSNSITIGSTTLVNTSSSFDIFLTKYSPNGNVIWAKKFGGNKNEVANCISVDNTGNIYLGGSFESSSVNFGNSILNNNSIVSSDIFLTKFDTTGNVIWAKSAGGSFSEYTSSITIDTLQNVYISAIFQSPTMVFGTSTLTNAGYTDSFLAKYDSNGTPIWVKKFGGPGSDDAKSVKIDKQGNIYMTGGFSSSSIIFDSIILNNLGGDGDMFIVKYNSSGNVIWAENAGGTGGSAHNQGSSLTIDTIGNIYVAGDFSSSTITFGSTVLSNAGDYSLFLVKYSSNGNVVWAKASNGSDNNSAAAVALDLNNKIYIGGKYFSPTILFGSTLLTNYSNNGTIADLFIAKLDNTIGIENLNQSQLIFAFPNPFSSQTTLRSNRYFKDATLKVCNIFGQTVNQIDNLTGQTTIIQRDNLPSGLYFIQIIVDNKIVTTNKVIIADN